MSFTTPILHRRNFPDGFTFGAATAAFQIEGASSKGGRGPSIWDTFVHRYPGRVQDGKNGNVAIDSYNRVKEDVQIMKKIGLDAYRFSISWPRLLPTGRLNGGVNREGIDYYNTLIDELLENGIEPYATLFHWDLPQLLEDDYQGFLDKTVENKQDVYGKNIVRDFRDYADLCFWEFGDRVKYWITFNETWSFSVAGYVNGTFAPGRGATTEETTRSLPALGRFGTRSTRLVSDARQAKVSGVSVESLTQGDPGTEPYIVTHNQLLCHAHVVKLYKDKYQSCQKGKIGITLVSIWTEPLTDDDEDQKAAIRSREFMFGWLMDPVTFGDYPSSMRAYVKNRLPKFADEEKALLKGSYDFLGLNYYTANYATPLIVDENNPPTPDYNTDSRVTLLVERDGVPIGEKPGADWLYVYPVGIYNLLKYIKDTYNDPIIYITENGVNELDDITLALPNCSFDQFRIDYISQHLCQIKDAIYDGVDVKGYFAWSLMDNFEWASGYTVRFGLVYIDYNKELARHPKDSAKWFKNFLKKEDSTPSRKRALSFTHSQAKVLKK